MSANLMCYSLEEIVAEKLRTPLQALKRATEGKWLRSCARDYYALWYLTASAPATLNCDVVGSILAQKCRRREVDFKDVDDFLPPLVVTEAERQCRSGLADLVRSLPSFEHVITELRQRIPVILASSKEPSRS